MIYFVITAYVNEQNEDKIFYCTSTFIPKLRTNLEKNLEYWSKVNWKYCGP